MKRRLTGLLVLVAFVAGCAGEKMRPDVDPVAAMEKGRLAFSKKRYEEAQVQFREVLTSRPPAAVRTDALFLLGEASFGREEFAEARSVFGEFVGLVPTDPRVPTAMLRIAETHYAERNAAERDITPLREARAAFLAFLERFPDHAEAAAARERVRQCEAALAAHELAVAQLYAARGAWEGAAGRLEGVLREFPSLPGQDKVLYDLIVALKRSGAGGRMEAYRARLVTAHPDSPWTQQLLRETEGKEGQ